MCMTLVVHQAVTYAIVALTEPQKYSDYLCIVSKPQDFTKTSKAIQPPPPSQKTTTTKKTKQNKKKNTFAIFM